MERLFHFRKRSKLLAMFFIATMIGFIGIANSAQMWAWNFTAPSLSSPNAIDPKTAGDIVFDTTNSNFLGWNGSNWINFSGTIPNLAVDSISLSTTITDDDDVILADPSSGTFTITLPTAVGNSGKVFYFKKVDTSSNIVTIDGDGSQTIDGQTTLLLSSSNEAVQIVSDGSNWKVSGSHRGKRSQIRVHTANGYGSTTNNKIRRFSTVVDNFGGAITYTDSASDGASFTINVPGVYAISYDDSFNSAHNLGISVNSSSLTTSIISIAASERLKVGHTDGTDATVGADWTGYLNSGDIIRPHMGGSGVGVSPALTTFTIVGPM